MHAAPQTDAYPYTTPDTDSATPAAADDHPRLPGVTEHRDVRFPRDQRPGDHHPLRRPRGGDRVAWGWGFTWHHAIMLVASYLFSAIGITVGFHRLFTHRLRDLPRRCKFVLAMLGSMAVQGPLLKWVAMHRRHHQHSDTDGDPHSPHHHGRGSRRAARPLARPRRLGVRAATRRTSPATSPTSPDKLLLRVVSALFPLVGRARPADPGGPRRAADGTLDGRLLGFVWGGLVAGLPGPPRDLEHQLRLPPVGHAGRSAATTRAATTPCSAFWRWARGGTTTTTPSPPPPATACAGGSWTPATRSSAAWSCAGSRGASASPRRRR